ncbi:Protein of unknown function [Lactobacillus hominis DSM 23910 = CRBIP 24.179]|uniref:Uncharacterized protein n=1 Tax=Lactobacillus hominis DSM 23910 = CRBIP 24.179 TaxID=1423758 RepID=I7L9Q9_9LACO|nr:Protein of unknown function [Lactobacillus hominis DSM 23910 = CRBIP 24.179]
MFVQLIRHLFFGLASNSIMSSALGWAFFIQKGRTYVLTSTLTAIWPFTVAIFNIWAIFYAIRIGLTAIVCLLKLINGILK